MIEQFTKFFGGRMLKRGEIHGAVFDRALSVEEIDALRDLALTEFALPKIEIEMIPTFRSEDWFELTGRGWVAVTRLDRDCDDFSHLIGKQVRVDGIEYRCSAIESHPIGGRRTAGERIGLLVDGVPPENRD